jgi:sulfite exporter TauE/SafE
VTPVEFSAIFVLGLMSSLHCVQMCGPIVLSYSLPLAKAARRQEMLVAHAAYNLGRITTYAALGAVAGVAGGGLNIVSRAAGVANGARICAGLALIVTAVLISGALPQAGLVRIGPVGGLSRVAGRILLSPRPLSKLPLGLVLGLLPCGLVYAALLKSVETGTAAGGALTMVAFGLGTAFALTSFGIASSVAGIRLGRWSNAVSTAGVALMGVFLIWSGLTGPVSHAHHG